MDASDPQPDLPQNKPGGVTPDALEALQYHFYKLRSQHEALRNLFFGTVAALILLSLGLNLFIGKQMRMVRTQLDEFRPQVTRVATDFKERREPAIRSFLSQLQSFASVHREFQQVLEKYRPLLAGYLSAPVTPPTAAKPGPAPAPAPTPAPAPAKKPAQK